MKNTPDIVKYGDEAVSSIRKEINMQLEEDREQAIKLLQEWVRQQHHFIKKEFSKSYLERCLVVSKGSVERAKLQIDKMCTFRTLMPQYFKDLEEVKTDFWSQLSIGYIGFLPQLTQDNYRVLLIKIKPEVSVISPNITTVFFQYLVLCAEFLKSNDYHKGVLIIVDCYDRGLAEVLYKINLFELQQFVPILTILDPDVSVFSDFMVRPPVIMKSENTWKVESQLKKVIKHREEGYGAKMKGIIIVTASKLLQSFIKMVKPFFSEKIGSRFHAASSRQQLQDIVLPVEILPEEYGGKEISVQKLNDNLRAYITSETHQNLMREMNAAKTDETKRETAKFNEQYMGMPGTFRTLSVD